MATPSDKQRVQVWFGSEVICSHTTADPEQADRYARLMGQRFAGLRVTIDKPPGSGSHGAPLPHPLLWDRTPV